MEGLGHCGECHNRSKLTGASDWSGKLEGGKIEGWYAPNITSDGKQGIGQWAKNDIVKYLKTGLRPDGKTVAAGPMRETIDESLSKMTDGDLGAIAAYLKATAAKQTVSNEESSKGVPIAASAGDAYLSHCASCHQRDGKGIAGAVPALAGNGAVMAKGPEDVIRAVLGGLQAHDGLAPMPALGQTMTDEDIADAVNYVRKSWGNNAPDDVGPGAVGDLRKKALTMLAMNADQPCAPIKDESLKKAIDQSDAKAKLETMKLDTMLPTIDAVLPSIKKDAPDAKPDAITNALTARLLPRRAGEGPRAAQVRGDGQLRRAGLRAGEKDGDQELRGIGHAERFIASAAASDDSSRAGTRERKASGSSTRSRAIASAGCGRQMR